MSSFLPGTRKSNYDNVMIRGYYGDLVMSPYIGFGIHTPANPEMKHFYHKRNYDYVYVSFFKNSC